MNKHPIQTLYRGWLQQTKNPDACFPLYVEAFCEAFFYVERWKNDTYEHAVEIMPQLVDSIEFILSIQPNGWRGDLNEKFCDYAAEHLPANQFTFNFVHLWGSLGGRLDTLMYYTVPWLLEVPHGLVARLEAI